MGAITRFSFPIAQASSSYPWRQSSRWLHMSCRRANSPVPEAALEARPAKFETNGTREENDTPEILKDIWERRKAAGRLVAGVAAASNSDMFKAPTRGKPKARQWASYLSKESQSREPCNLKQAARYVSKPGLISLGGGLPSSEYFPFSSLSMQVSSSLDFSEHSESKTSVSIGKYDATRPSKTTVSHSTGPLHEASEQSVYDLSIGLNYAQSTGSAQLLRFITEHTELVHNPAYADWRCAATIGSTGALEQALRMLCDRARGDSVITDDFSFATALETLAPLGIKTVGVSMDGEGLLPEVMDDVLTNWNEGKRGYRKPHVLYAVPCGQNPTGATQGVQRRKDVYAVAKKHDLFIIEDDPYYFLQLPQYNSAASTPLSSKSTTQYLDSLLPSLLSLDTDGRVMRMDSFSKMLIPGSRTGWITASAEIVDRFVMHSEVANQGPSGLSQLVLHRLLDETWGHDGFLRWLAHLGDEYAWRRDTIVRACEEHLPADVVTWVPPRAGMFIWFKIDHLKHPHGSDNLLEIEETIFNSCIDKGVLVARGSWFHTEKDRPLSGLYFRATYASASKENMTEAVRRFGQALRDVFELK